MRTIKCTSLAIVTLLLTALALQAGEKPAAVGKPNIVFLFSDDQAEGAVGC